MSEREGPPAPTRKSKLPAEGSTEPTGEPGHAGDDGPGLEDLTKTPPETGPADKDPAGKDPAGKDPASEHPVNGHAGEALIPGPVGQRFSRTSPFYIGLVGGLGVLTAWLLATALGSARGVLVLIVVALYLAMGLNPIVEWFVRRRVKRGWGVLAVFTGLLAGFGLVILAIVPVVTVQVTALANRVPVWVAQLQQNQSIREFDQDWQVTKRITDYIMNGQLAEQAASGVIGFGALVFSTLFAALTLLVLTLYFLGSLPSIMSAVYRIVPRSRRERVSYLGNEIVQKIGSYVGGQLLVAGLAGVMSFIFLNLVGLGDFALALAVAVTLFDLIPLIGGAISAVVVTSIGFLTSIPIGIACAIYYVVYQQIENYVIMPRVMTRAVSVPGAVIIVAALLGGSLLGMVGALLAVPTAAAILIIVRQVVLPRQDHS